MLNVSRCPCESGLLLANCCEPIISGSSSAQSAEALMRSRYSGYVLLARDYLLRSWHATTRPPTLTLPKSQRWLGLKIVATTRGSWADDSGEVEFVARYKIDGRGHRLHERSRFLKEDGVWYYLDGDLIEKKK